MKIAKEAEKIVAETKLSIIRDILNDVHSYDARFDATHVVHIDDIVMLIMNAQVNDVLLAEINDRR